jgi:hypothetical protein
MEDQVSCKEDSENQSLTGDTLKEDRPRDYLKNLVFPVLLPGIEELLKTWSKLPRRKQIHFNPVDFLSEYLYRHNPKHEHRQDLLWDATEFVQRVLAVKPRRPQPLSATLTEEEAATTIQSWMRGHMTRCDPDIQELRQWMTRLRTEHEAAQRIQRFWLETRKHKSKLQTADTPKEMSPNQTSQSPPPQTPVDVTED